MSDATHTPQDDDYNPGFPEGRFLWQVFQFKLDIAEVTTDPFISLLYTLAGERVREVTRIHQALKKTKAACDEALEMLAKRNQLFETASSAFDVNEMISSLRKQDNRIGELVKAIVTARRKYGEMSPAERKVVARRAAQQMANSLDGKELLG